MTTRLLLVCLIAACNPYNPDLGPEPFRCGTDEPRCPEGYGPFQRDDITCICTKGADPMGPDGSSFICNVDPNENPDGNMTISDPTPTTIGQGMSMWSAMNIALCPAGDKDVYSMALMGGETVSAAIVFPAENGDLRLEILNAAGNNVASGEMVGSQLRASYAAQANGTYYVRVEGGLADTENNYSIQITVDST